MKTRKLITGILTFAFISIALAFLNTSKAAISDLGYVKITPDRTATVKYTATNPDNPSETKENTYTANYAHRFGLDKATSKNVWNLVTCNADKTENNKAQDLYCLRAGLGFTQDLAGTNYNPNPVLYNQEFDMIKDYESVKKTLSDLHSETTIFNNKTNFNSVMWILDNMLLEGASEEEYIDYLIKFAGYNNNTGAGIDGTSLNFAMAKENVLTRADIEAIQQMAIWYFTNSDEAEYHSDTIKPVYVDIENIKNCIFDTNGEYKLFSDIYNTTEAYGTFKQQAAGRLYSYLITEAKKAQATTSNGLYNPKREITIYLGADAAKEQPIVEVKEKTPKADIVLRKYISAIGDIEYDRAPIVDTSELNKIGPDGKLQTTAKYYHPKKPLSAQIGKTVTYTLRLYNESDIDTYIKEVTDYLPSYIEFEPVRKDKKDAYWQQDADGRIASTSIINENGEKECLIEITNAGGKLDYSKISDKKLSNVLIPAAQYNPDKKDTENAYTLSWVEIQISGRVMRTAPYDTAITNVAQVTEIKDEHNQPITDRDSVSSLDSTKNGFELPVDEQLPSYTGGKEDENGVGKPCYDESNAIKYDGQDENKKDWIYYPGQEDDDDFDKIIIEKPAIDLALRKYISAIGDTKYDRAPRPNTDGLRAGTSTDAIYNHSKDPSKVKAQIGDVVTYTIRLYNEGDVPAKVAEVTDYTAKNLKYVKGGQDTNADMWTETLGKEYNTVVTTDKCIVTNVGGKTPTACKGEKLQDVIIPAYDKGRDVLSWIEIEIHCQIQKVAETVKLTNIAEITEERDEYDRPVDYDRPTGDDKESTPGNVEVPDDKDLPGYKEDKEEDPYVPGQEDDDDFEKVLVVVPEVDLSLRKYISAIDGEPLKGENLREPTVNTRPLDTAKTTTADYYHTKTPMLVHKGSLVTYTIRVYNEGEIDAYVSEITDYLPNYLIYQEDNPINKKYGWTYDSKTRKVVTTITALDHETQEGEETYEDREAGKLLHKYPGAQVLDYIEVEIVCKVDENAIGKGILTNIAQITKIHDKDGNLIEEDRDSKPDDNLTIPEDEQRPNYTGGKNEKNDPYYDGSNVIKGKEDEEYYPGQEDDDDFEKVQVIPEFDLALRKFITKTGTLDINNRAPEVIYEDGKITYNHPKNPLEVVKGDIIEYTIRVYNEGEADGYAQEITDDMPEGLEFLPDNELNKQYRWKMLDADQKETTDVSKAKYIVTDYLSEEQEKETKRDNKIKAFNPNADITNSNPDYRDVKVAFKVVYEAKTKEETKRILVNVAQISDDKNEYDEPDKDSDPDRDEPYDTDGDNEDDIDFDNVKVKYFDLSLLKWVAKTKITENGKTVIKDTGHTVDTALNEKPYKVPELTVKDIKTVNIKFIYTIRVTNEGEIPGYATEVKDYIPEGLEFKQEDNPDWKLVEGEKNVVVTDKLKDTLLKENGGYAEVEIVLTWINGSNNLGEKINLAEISQDKNDSDSPDVDSTPDNKEPGEDDIDEAPVILVVKTGSVPLYIGLTLAVLAIFASGVILIKKYVLE